MAAPPDAYNDEYKKWRIEHLPIIPDNWIMEPIPRMKKQLAVIGRLLKKHNEVVIATDAGREGELIARETLAYFAYKGHIKKLSHSSVRLGRHK